MKAKLPKYRLHKPSGRAVVQFRPLYGPNPKYLDGLYDSPESRRHYAACIKEIADWQQKRTPGKPTGSPSPLVAELAADFLIYARTYYEFDSGEASGCERAIDPLLDDAMPWWDLPADEFGPLALKAYRQTLIDAGSCRTYINKQVNRVRRMFKWGVANERIGAGVLVALQTVDGLRRGKTTAREKPKVIPVEWRWVEATIPFLKPHVAAMVWLQWLTGMRPDEVTGMKGEHIDASHDVWLYQPPHHKTEWRGKVKIICIGPKAQAILAPYVRESGLIFSPAMAVSAKRTKRLCDRYRHRSYRRSIWYGLCAAAKQGVLLPGWHPHRIRHARGTITRADFGIEAAQAQLGNTLVATEIYAEKSLQLAIKVALESG